MRDERVQEERRQEKGLFLKEDIGREDEHGSTYGGELFSLRSLFVGGKERGWKNAVLIFSFVLMKVEKELWEGGKKGGCF